MKAARPAKPAIRVEISNRQAVCRVDRKRVAALLTFFFRRSVPRSRAAPFHALLALLVTDNRRMPDFKNRFFGIREETDVIAISYGPLPGEDAQEGELIVNAERAVDVVAQLRAGRMAQMPRLGAQAWNISFEFALYLAHGVDHLSGADDATPQERRRMRRRELGWLRAAQTEGLIGKLIDPAARKARKPA